MNFVRIVNNDDIFRRIDNLHYTFERFAEHLEIPTMVLNGEPLSGLVIVLRHVFQLIIQWSPDSEYLLKWVDTME